MGLWGRTKGALGLGGPGYTRHSLQALPTPNPQLAEFPRNRDTRKDMEAFYANEIVYACTRLRSEMLAEGKPVAMRDGEAVDSGRVYELLQSPDGELSIEDWLACFQLYHDLAGNVYVLKERNAMGAVLGWRLLRPDRVKVRYGGALDMPYYEYTAGRGQIIPYPMADIGHFRAYDPLNDWQGLSHVAICARMLNIDNLQTRLVYTYMSRAGVPAGWLRHSERFNSPAEYEAWRERLRQSVSDMNVGKYGILEGEGIDLIPAGQFTAPEQAQVRQQTESRICAVFRVDPRLIQANVGIQASSGTADTQQARKAFAENTMMPLWRRTGGFLNRLAVTDFPSERATVKIDTSDVRALQESEDALFARANRAFATGLFTRNQALAYANQPMIEGEAGDAYSRAGAMAIPVMPMDQQALERARVGLQRAIDGRLGRGGEVSGAALIGEREEAEFAAAGGSAVLARIRAAIDGAAGEREDRAGLARSLTREGWRGMLAGKEQDDG